MIGILIVEDEHVTIEDMRTQLNQLGYTVSAVVPSTGPPHSSEDYQDELPDSSPDFKTSEEWREDLFEITPEKRTKLVSRGAVSFSKIEPVAEKTLHTELKYEIEPGECFIITEKKPKVAFEIFIDLVTHGIPGLVISREHPERIKKRYDLEKTPMLWLSQSGVENSLHPQDISYLDHIFQRFCGKSEQSVILFNGLEYLISQTSFDCVLRLLHSLKDTIVLHEARLIIPLHRGTLSVREFSILEKEFFILESD